MAQTKHAPYRLGRCCRCEVIQKQEAWQAVFKKVNRPLRLGFPSPTSGPLSNMFSDRLVRFFAQAAHFRLPFNGGTRLNCSRKTGTSASFQITWFARSIFVSIGHCADRRPDTCSAFQPRARRRADCRSTVQAMQITLSKFFSAPVSKSNGITTTPASTPFSRQDWTWANHSRRINGCKIPSNRPRAAASEKMICARRPRSIPPSAPRTFSPNAPITASNPGVPAATTVRATSSVSITGNPASFRIPAAMLFPIPGPPVKP